MPPAATPRSPKTNDAGGLWARDGEDAPVPTLVRPLDLPRPPVDLVEEDEVVDVRRRPKRETAVDLLPISAQPLVREGRLKKLLDPARAPLHLPNPAIAGVELQERPPVLRRVEPVARDAPDGRGVLGHLGLRQGRQGEEGEEEEEEFHILYELPIYGDAELSRSTRLFPILRNLEKLRSVKLLDIRHTQPIVQLLDIAHSFRTITGRQP